MLFHSSNVFVVLFKRGHHCSGVLQCRFYAHLFLLFKEILLTLLTGKILYSSTCMMDRASVKSYCSEVVDTFTSLNVCLGLLISEGAMLTVLTSHVQLYFVVVGFFCLFVFSSSFKQHQLRWTSLVDCCSDCSVVCYEITNVGKC